ncbi:MAG: hypothetical protein UX09_C0006G0004 [Candidatus Uhrbacteria bacterium GW2011_GWE2_45_35]|uniref:Uncharacterized protein n=2 Tax=Candidatus Uhriibacteriota TaxID=1752732 RepID=A0A0G1J9E2_9BACT|nr:MAG: hypothetical protein UW63_C0090G0005 [Candidatus Uhrbacteria bacterium GW2011_GWF2_44_350]KKU09008.1 MAG: hypothetical protein UX09_C0006G0004 [Candidatus Uhrbacteria bacterium GW2011_GWE2_45_35]HBR81129.1 hypothetical protein [Candidatus Uhrbacteria bacterium]HCU31635.1 hypothetical protein [Candidatus Uhrbacteria bacterium]
MKFSRKKIFLLLSLLVVLLLPTIVLADAQTGICSSGTSSASDVGVFMEGICTECWEQGNCSIADIMTVVANVGNFILSIVGSLVFLVYIIGGFWWIASHGDPAWVTKGKKWIGSATLGLIIVLFAYTGVVALKFALVGQVSEGYVVCAGTETNGQLCDINSVCSGFSCISECESGGGFCTDQTSAGIFETNGDGACAGATNSCPVSSQYCCMPNSTAATTSP